MLEGEEPIATAQYGKTFNNSRICPICAKTFYIESGCTDMYAYKRVRANVRVYMCSWKCLNDYDKERKNAKKKRNADANRKRAEQNGGENS